MRQYEKQLVKLRTPPIPMCNLIYNLLLFGFAFQNISVSDIFFLIICLEVLKALKLQLLAVKNIIRYLNVNENIE